MKGQSVIGGWVRTPIVPVFAPGISIAIDFEASFGLECSFSIDVETKDACLWIPVSSLSSLVPREKFTDQVMADETT